MTAALAEWGIDDLLAEVRHSPERFLQVPYTPPREEPSLLATIALGTGTLVLLAGWLIGYPVFRRSPADAPVRRSLAVGEELPVHVRGKLPSAVGVVRVDADRGFVARLPAVEVARMKWRYWGSRFLDYRQEIERAAATTADGRDRGRLVIYSPARSVVWEVPTASDAIQVEPGVLYTPAEGRPSLRVLGRNVEAVLTFANAAERDRAAGELT